jgi:hypothetical protein
MGMQPKHGTLTAVSRGGRHRGVIARWVYATVARLTHLSRSDSAKR